MLEIENIYAYLFNYNTAMVEVISSWVGTTVGELAAVQLFSAMAMIGVRRPW